MYLLITRVKPMVAHFSDFAFCYEKRLRSDNQSQKNKQPQAFVNNTLNSYVKRKLMT